MAGVDSPFMRMPSEIRHMIYDYLFDDNGNEILEIRNTNPDVYARSFHRRTGYRILGQGLVRQSRPTTYELVTSANICTSILSVSRQIHGEASQELYGSHKFGFGKDVEALVPFFSDLTSATRQLVPGISLVKRGSVYCRDYDRCEWGNVCAYIRENLRLNSMDLVVEGGRPSSGWDGLHGYTVADFKTLSLVKYEPLDWVWELLAIKGLRSLNIQSEIHHCPPSHSSAMEFFASFSSTIETSFADFLRVEMEQ